MSSFQHLSTFNIPKQTSKTFSQFENNAIDIKNFYVNYLIYLLKPSLIDGIVGLYKDVENIKNKNGVSTIQLFKESLKNIKFLKSNQIINFVVQLKDNTQSVELLEKTIKAVLKSYIILLTHNDSNKTAKLLSENYHSKVNINEFIYRCYVEFSQSIFLNVDVFIKYNSNILNYSEQINDLIYSAIETTIFKTLPISEILDSYLSSDSNNSELLKELTKFIISTLSKVNNDNADKILSTINDFVNSYNQQSYRSQRLQQSQPYKSQKNNNIPTSRIIKSSKSDYNPILVPISHNEKEGKPGKLTVPIKSEIKK